MPEQLGYDPNFLGLPLPLPTAGASTIALDYVHFTVLLNPNRRLAAVTGVNLHGGLLVEIVRRKDTWFLDTRAPASDQAGPALYERNDFDRGHMTRRRDPGWGTPAMAKAANDDTFHYVNAAPQAAVLNQSKNLWAGLEDYLLEHAATYDQRLSVFTGPVFQPTDPVYRGVQIPLQFYKIAAWLQEDHLECTGYVLDQIDLVKPILTAGRALEAAPPLGPFKTFQVPVSAIADLTGLSMPVLLAADILQSVPAGAAGRVADWIPLTTAADMTLSTRRRRDHARVG
jgi:endonuclease G